MDERPNFQEIAVSGDGEDITKGMVDELRRPRDEVLRTRASGDIAVYEGVMRDDQVHSCFQQRRYAVVAREWKVEPGGSRRQDKKAADFIREQLERIRFDAVTMKMLSGVFYGYAVAECLWAPDGAQVALEAIKVRRQKRFAFDWAGRLRLITQDHPKGLVMPERKFWVFSTGGDDDDDPYGLGLAHWLYWPVWLKRNGLKFWSIFMEKFAAPTAVGRVPRGATLDERQRLLAALRAITMDSGLVVPEGVQVDLLEAARRSGSDYAAFYKLMDAAIAKIILSQTMTTDDGSSRAQAEVHENVKLEVVKADADLICESCGDQVIRWLVDWNFPGAAYPKVWRDVTEPEDLKARADRDKVIFDMGYRPTQDYINTTYGEGFEPRQAPAPAGPDKPTASFAEGEEAKARDAVDDLAEQLDTAAAPAMDALIDEIRRAIETSASIPEAIERLEKLYPRLRPDDLAAVIGEALAVADLTGRAEAPDA